MKKYKSIVVSAFLSLFMVMATGCNDFLDKAPDDQLTMEMIFSDKVRTEDGVWCHERLYASSTI